MRFGRRPGRSSWSRVPKIFAKPERSPPNVNCSGRCVANPPSAIATVTWRRFLQEIYLLAGTIATNSIKPTSQRSAVRFRPKLMLFRFAVPFGCVACYRINWCNSVFGRAIRVRFERTDANWKK